MFDGEALEDTPVVLNRESVTLATRKEVRPDEFEEQLLEVAFCDVTDVTLEREGDSGKYI